MRAPLLPQKVRLEQERQAVQAWVAALRAKIGLAALPLQRMPQVTKRFSVIHDRVQLHAVKQALHKQRQRLLGENRARGHTLNQALTMLWISPFHRDLLLHDKAAYIYTVMDEGLKLFGEGRFFWEFGSHVKFGCPRCWKYDLHQCDTCY